MIVRAATEADADGMVHLLNAIIEKGGTTAHQTLFDADRMRGHYIAPAENICCHVAVTGAEVLGFQSLIWPDPAPPMPQGWALIASFVSASAAGQGVGRALLQATTSAARDAGVTTIDATIRADNASGLGYYSAMGFVDYAFRKGVPLSDGTPVDRIRKRLDL